MRTVVTVGCVTVMVRAVGLPAFQGGRSGGAAAHMVDQAQMDRWKKELSNWGLKADAPASGKVTLTVKAEKAVVALLSERHSLIDHLLREEPWSIGCLVLDEPGDGVRPADLPGLLMTIDARAEIGAVVILTADPNVIAWAGTQPAGRLGVAA